MAIPNLNPQLGVCYYPEHWPEDMWAKDAADMAALGISWVRIGEFAWSRLEPAPGKYDFGWLDRAVDTLGTAGLKVILCTPTATPPRWLVEQMPDMLAVDASGAARGFGSRRHYCFSHAPYRKACEAITETLAARYGDNPHIAAWQTDNEYGCHDTVISYSAAARTAFQDWLPLQYENIAALNAAWGNVFWSMEYSDFSQIELPNQTVTEANPAHLMDFRRFSSGQVTVFNRAQTDILRKATQAPLIHNYMGRVTEFDHFAVGADLDIASWDSYPLGFLEDRSDKDEDWRRRFMRQGDPDFQAFHHDLYRAVGRGRWWVMEQQPGPVNWAPYNPAPLKGMVRLWSLEAFAHGAEVVSYFRWRQAPFAQEQMHSALQNPDGSQASAWAEIETLGQDLPVMTGQKTEDAPVAIIFDYPSNWSWETQPQGRDFNYFRLVFDIYSALRRLGQNVDILPAETADFGDRKLVLIPGLFAWNDRLRGAVENTQAQVLIGPRSGSKTQDFQIPKTLPPDMDALGVKITAVESLRPDAPSTLEMGGAFNIWQESCEPHRHTKIIERRTDGAGALFQSGPNLFYLAGWPDETAAMRILQTRLERAGLAFEALPEGVRCRQRGGLKIYLNYNAQAKMMNSMTINNKLQTPHEIPPASAIIIDVVTGQRITGFRDSFGEE